jgi:hypothetical protein
MGFHPASPGSVLAFAALVAAVLAALLAGVQRAYRSARATGIAAAFLIVWLGGLSALIASGTLATLPLNGLPLFFGSILALCIAFGLSPVGGKLAANLPLAALVGFQAFRLPLELVLHSWAAQGTIPETMTWTGQNLDLISGALALIAAPLASRYPAIVRMANIVGFVLLVNVIRVAVMSSPLPFAWGQQPPLLLALHLPYALIGPVCVGGALFGHIVLTRKLWTAGRQR